MGRRSVAARLAVAVAIAALIPHPAFAGPEGPEIPQELAVPPGHRPLLKVVGKGSQIYKSVESPGGKLAWTLEAPLARLHDEQGGIVGSHYEGPSWESADGSKVIRDEAVPVKSAKAPAPGQDIPWLLVRLKADEGATGAFSKAVYVQRLQTSGGKEPSDAPKRKGTKVGVPYTAVYLFYEKI